MRVLRLLWPFLAAVLVFASPASAEPRRPTGKWVVDFADTQCLATRDFGTPDKPLTIMLKAPADGSVIQLYVVRKGASSDFAEQREGKLRFGAGSERKVSVLAYSPSKSGRRVFLYNLPRSEVTGWASKGQLQLRASGSLQETFEISGVPALMKIMDECVSDLRTYWNFAGDGDPPKLREKASAKLIALFSSDDYPYEAWRDIKSGRTSAILLVDQTGKVADCSLVETSGVAVLDGQTCAVIRERARYKPAVGLDGQPARSVDYASISWQARP